MLVLCAFLYIDMEMTAEEKERREVKRKVLEMAKQKDRFETEHQVSGFGVHVHPLYIK